MASESPSPRVSDRRTRVHRALGDPTRARLLWILTAEGPLDAHEAAQRVGAHVNTVRAHLDQLVGAGLVAREPRATARPGRPRLVYRPGPDSDEQPEPAPSRNDSYRFLALVLAGFLTETAEDPLAAAEAVGQPWGARLIRRPAPFERTSPEEALRRVHELMDEVGFEPEDAEGDDRSKVRMLLHHCPFIEVVRARGEAICALHLGLLRGGLRELNTEVTATALRPFVTSQLCVADLDLGNAE